MQKNVDRRIVQTKQKLRKAFADMMRVMSFDDITVFDLCDAANVRRATFYRHYTDKYHFLSCIVSTVLDEISERIALLEDIKDPTEYYCSYVNEVLSYFKYHREVLNNIISSTAFSTVKDIILHGTLCSFKHDLSKNISAGIELPARVDIMSEFLNGGIAQIMILWLTDDSIGDEAVLSSVRSLISRLIPTPPAQVKSEA